MRIFLLVICIIGSAWCCAQEQLILQSSNLPGNDTVWVFKPDNYSGAQKYPAIYLLHGKTGKYSSFSDLINLQDFANKYQFIIICPDGFYDAYYLNSPLIKNSQFESFFTNELYPYILKNFAVDSTKIVITGISMGGAGAMYLFVKYPYLFLSAGSISGVFNLNYTPSRYNCLSRLLGEYDSNKKVFDDYSVVNLVVNIRHLNKKILFDCGTEDPFYKSNVEFKEKCDKLGIDAEFDSRPGSHNIKYWEVSIVKHFDFFSSVIK